jgi:hypothetical protein
MLSHTGSRGAAGALWIAVLVALVSAPALSPALGRDGGREVPLETRIVSATMYSHQAQIVRRGEVRLERGTFSLICTDLPNGFAETSLNVAGSGLEGARIIGIDIRRTEKSGADSPRYKELSGELDTLNAKADELRIRRRAIEKRKGLAESLSSLSADKARDDVVEGTFASGDWQSLLASYEKETLGTEERLSAIDGESKDLQEKVSWVQSQLTAMQVAAGLGKEVVIDCEVTTPGTMTVELSYIVADATWRPQYGVRYVEREGGVELTYNARIVQATGEDWKDVAVVLSTATPHVGAAPPELSPQHLGLTTGTVRGRVTDALTGAPLAYVNVTLLGTPYGSTTSTGGTYVIAGVPAGASYILQASFIGYRNERQPVGRVVGGSSSRVDVSLHPAELTADEATIRALRPSTGAAGLQPGVATIETESTATRRGGRAPEVPYVEAEIQGSEFAANLAIPDPVDLETGAEPRRCMVVREVLPGDFVLECVPRLSDHVFVRGTFVNALEIPLLPGMADVYVETVPEGTAVPITDFVGQERLTAVAPGEDFTLYLGVDQSVKVAHELKRREVLSKAKSATVKVRYSYLMTLESFRRRPAEVRVIDRVPVSAMKDVKVDDVEITPTPATRSDDGLLEWQLTLEPGAREELTVQYVVEYPASMTPRELGLEE